MPAERSIYDITHPGWRDEEIARLRAENDRLKSMFDHRKLEVRIERLRAALYQITDNEYSGFGGMGGIARKALADDLEK